MALQGTIRDFGVADVLQLIGIQRKTGILTVSSSDDVVTVNFLQGEVVGADTKRRSVEDLLGSVLVSTGRITEVQLQEALRAQKKSLQRLGHVLVASRSISEEDLVEALRIQTLQIIYRLFRWRQGDFRFQSADNLEYDERHFQPISTDNILMEGARMVDEWPIIERRVKSDEMILRTTEAGARVDLGVTTLVEGDLDIDLGFGKTGSGEEDQPNSIQLSGEEREVLALVDGERTVEEVNERSTLGEFDTSRILAELLTRNLIEEVTRPSNRPDENQRREWRERLLVGFAMAVLAAVLVLVLATLGSNPVSPWRLAARDEATERLRFYTSQSRLERLDRAVMVFYLDTGRFPPDLGNLAIRGYVSSQDLLDPWSRPYAYSLSPGGYRLVGLDGAGELHSDLALSHTFTSVQRVMQQKVTDE